MVKIIVFDTETTGLPINDKVSALQGNRNWPDIVSIGWMVFENRTLVRKEFHLIRPEGFVIPPSATQIHGITHQQAEKEGASLRTVLKQFAKDIKRANVVVAHNLPFDKNVVFHAYKWRLGMDPTAFWNEDAEFCTMKQSQNELKLTPKKAYNNEPYKRPSLAELYAAECGGSFPHAHTVEGDVDALQRIFFSRWDIYDENDTVI